jgi:hypothetical protein
MDRAEPMGRERDAGHFSQRFSQKRLESSADKSRGNAGRKLGGIKRAYIKAGKKWGHL